MIKYPQNWCGIGHEIDPSDIADALMRCIGKLGVRNLSLSGGIDSTLLLYFMKKVLGNPIHCYTISFNEYHLDYTYAKMATEFFSVEHHPYFLRKVLEPDDIVKAFYEHLAAIEIKDIIAGDGIDEFACGYYSHLEDKSEQNYISWIRRMQAEQLIPLHQNSGDVNVYLPYLSSEVVKLLSLVPLYEKIDAVQRKMLVYYMAKGNIPKMIIERRKYGFCDATITK